MAGIFHHPLDRRHFLRLSILGCAAVVSAPAAAEADLHLALISDTHVPADKVNGHRGFNPWDNLRKIVPDIESAKPQGVLLSGDAARLEGLPGDYEAVKELLAPLAAKRPVYIGLGNHDDRANFAKAFPNPAGAAQAVKDKHIMVVEHPLLRIVILDSLLYVNKSAGLLGAAQRAWLSQFLAAHRDKPVMIFVHHTLGENDGDLADAPRFFDILKPHRQVKAVFFGHSHVWEIKERQGIQLINLPAVGYNFRDQDPVGWVEARFGAKQAELTLHAFAGNRAEDGKKFMVPWS